MSPDDFAYPIAPEARASYPSLAGKRVLITGGGSGIGAGTHPGAGIPGVVGSAKATAALMLED